MVRSGQLFELLFVLFSSVLVLAPVKCGPSIAQGKGKVIKNPVYIDNYIPAAMHVMFHLIDLMKYEMKPAEDSSSTTTTVRPTPPHKPGYYAPEIPLGPYRHFSRSSTKRIYNNVQQKMQQETHVATKFVEIPLDFKLTTPLPQDLDLLGAGPKELLNQINTLEDVDTIGDDDVQIARFSANYDDTANVDYLRKKRVPPTRAYVTLISLYDMFNKESKELGLNKYNGYSDKILNELVNTSSGSSEEQLKFVLNKVVQNKNTVKGSLVSKIEAVLKDLDKPNSYIGDAIKFIPALQFTL